MIRCPVFLSPHTMKAYCILALLLLATCLAVPAQELRQQRPEDYYHKFPEAALQEADSLYRAGMKRHDPITVLKALILKSTFAIRKDYDRYPREISSLEEMIRKEKKSDIRCLLHSYTAELYQAFRERNSWSISQRTPLSGEVPPDMNLWSDNLFDAKISEHLRASIAPQKTLQETPAKFYEAIFIPGAASDSLQPTLYDFLCYRFSDLAPEEEAGNPTAELYGDAATFAQGVPAEAENSTVSVFRQLLAFRLREKEQAPAALIWADLERLRKIHSLYDSPELYRQRLECMMQEYASHPLVVEVIADYARSLQQRSYGESPRQQQETLKRILTLCEEGIGRYGAYPRIGRLKQIANQLTYSSAHLQLPQEVYPDEEFEIQLTYRHLKELRLDIVKLPDQTLYRHGDRREEKGPGERCRQMTIRLQEKLISQDTTLRVEGLPAGVYSVRLHGKGLSTPYSRILVSTALFSQLQEHGDRIKVQVLDFNSGFPVSHARVSLYHRRGAGYQPAGSLLTDAEGCAYCKKEEQEEIFYRITRPENPGGTLYPLRVSTYPLRKSREAHTRLITDRPVYRPGESVLFKGYSWNATPERLSARAGIKQQILFRDANRKEIGSTDATTNPYGTFTGEFVIPADAMNGTYHLQCDGFQCDIQVTDYKRPKFEIRLEVPEQSFHSGDTIRIRGKARGYSGFNIAHTPVRYRIENSGYLRRERNPLLSEGQVYTGPKGEFEIVFTAPESSPAGRYPSAIRHYQITATLTDGKGETQESRTGVSVLPGKAMPRLEIERRINKQSPAVFGILLSDYPAERPQRIRYRLEKLVSPARPTEKPDTLIEKRIAEGELLVRQRDSLVLSLQEQPSGSYLFTAENDSARQQQIFYLYSPEDKRPPVATYDWLIEEKTVCRDGEKARVLFGSSMENVYVQYEVFSGNRSVWRSHRVISNEIIPIEIPYLKAYDPEIFLYVTCLKDKHYTEHIIRLKRARQLPELKIETRVFRDRLVPGEEEEWQLEITDRGRAARTEVLAMMYDASLEKIYPHRIGLHPQLSGTPTYPLCYHRAMPYNRQPLFLNRARPLYEETYTPAFDFNVLFNRYVPPRMYTLMYASKSALNIASGDMSCEVEGEGALPSPTEPAEIREELQPTAFFFPQLHTDTTGKASIRFTAPDALTRWKFVALATSREMGCAMLERTVTTSKPLMVQPNLPRFLRSEDQAEVQATVSNLTDSLQQGSATLELLLPGSQEVIVREEATFRIAAQSNGKVSFRFDVPKGREVVICRITARCPHFSDGEQQYLPILANEIPVNTTLPIFVNTAGKHTFALEEKHPGKRYYRLTLEMTANPIWYAVQALPTLQQPAHENITDIAAAYYANAIAARIVAENPACADAIRQWLQRGKEESLSPLFKNPELKSILAEATPWAAEARNETERIQSLATLFDRNRLEYLQWEVLRKMAELQNADGGWSWFKEMPSSAFMTLNTLNAMQRVALHAQQPAGEQEKTMQFRAIRYLDRELAKSHEHKIRHLSHQQILYLYVRSLYRDIPLGEALAAHKHLTSLAQKEWGGRSFYEKALLAMAFQHYGFREEAKQVIESLRQYAVTTPEYGMYWPNNRSTLFRHSAVQTHTAILEAFEEIQGNTPEIERMQQWLLRQKEVQNWGSVPSTVDAIHALLLCNGESLSKQETIDIKIGPQRISSATAHNVAGYLKVSYPASEITPRMLKVEIEKGSSTPSWGGLYLQSFQRLDEIEQQETLLKIEKRLYTEESDERGRKELASAEQRRLKVGDKVIVRLVISLKQDMEYLHLKDLRAACLEPTEQLSGYECRNGLSYYKEVKDAGTNYFFHFLPRGTYVLEYPAWVNQNGTYQDGTTQLQSIYAPVYNTYSHSTRITVGE